jgi:hypothetical protein
MAQPAAATVLHTATVMVALLVATVLHTATVMAVLHVATVRHTATATHVLHTATATAQPAVAQLAAPHLAK